jgi:hypothetical protein
MPDVVWLEFQAPMGQELYDQVNDRVNPAGSPPPGLIFHCAGPSPDGGWRIVDVWDSRATFDQFLQEKVLPAIGEIVGEEAMAGGSPPEIVSWPAHNYNAA